MSKLNADAGASVDRTDVERTAKRVWEIIAEVPAGPWD